MNVFSKRNRAILAEMVRTDFKVRYQGSALGYLWSILKPLALFGIMYIVFTVVWPVARGVDYYGVYLLLGIVFWNFFTETTAVGAQSIVSNGSLLRKIDIPRYLIVIASSVSALINLGLSLLVVIIFAVISGVPFSSSWLLVIFFGIQLYILAVGIALILTTVHVQFRDIAYIWEILLQGGFYASAIIFPLQAVPVMYHKYFFLNPVVQIIQDARFALIQSPDVVTLWNSGAGWKIKLVPFILTIIICVFGVLYFRKKSKYFAENV